MVNSIYEINRATQAELSRIRKDTNMTSDEKVEAMSQTQVEQQQSLAQILGPEAFQHWLQSNPAVH
jgi:DNA-binding TFAR19-related protein (PDSD5 family)